jgi:hypothetical protein
MGVLGRTTYRRTEMFRVSEHTTVFTIRADNPSTIIVEVDISFQRRYISTTLHDVTSRTTKLVNPHYVPYFCCFRF